MSTEARRRRGEGKGHDYNTAPDDAKVNAVIQQIEADHRRLLDLHDAWRTYLFWISIPCLMLALRHCVLPTSLCASDIRDHNADVPEGGEVIGKFEEFFMHFENGMIEYVAALQVFVLSYYLSRRDLEIGNFHAVPYLISSMMVPIQVTLYLQKKRMGCAGREDLWVVGEEEYVYDVRRRSLLPLGVIFHIVVTVSMKFVKKGRERSERNTEIARDVQRQLADAKNRKPAKKR
uniref:Uncharacterized protein n=1 Tax=Trieres chinensis TaxID=1514140 RepID=A0A6U1V610_TRICV|mmetsp:Transcript_248/g.572  ORF Transcript_248/g.572 Transcript_248/m.572 type:complete len:233 (+) Transcript_248:60-758(+)